MTRISAYWRPSSIEEALTYLGRPGAMVIGGGTRLHALSGAELLEVVDLQDLGLAAIERLGPDAMVIGAMATLQELAESNDVPAAIREAAKHELPSTLRAQATVGGCIAGADRESELLATLLAHDAAVHLAEDEQVEELTLEALLPRMPLGAGRIITAVTIDTRGTTAVARSARTHADRAIVSAVARVVDGERRLALSGVADTPVLVDQAGGLEPFSDYRGSAEYRRNLAEVLVSRVMKEIS